MHEDPLSVRPSVVVFGVERECLGCELELAGRILEREDDGSAVLPATQTKRGQGDNLRGLFLGECGRAIERTRPGRT